MHDKTSPDPSPAAEIIPATPNERPAPLVPFAPPSPHEEQLADRLLHIILAKTAAHRAANGAGPLPPGFVPPEKLYGPVTAVPPEIGGAPNGRSLWKFFVWGIFDEIKIVARMYFDPRYRLSRVAQFGVPILLGLFVLNYFFWNYTCALPIVPQVAERLMYIPFTLALYKVLVREVDRYREVLAYLARYG